MASRSCLKRCSSPLWSTAIFSSALSAATLAILYPSMMVWGWIFWSTSFSASRRSSAASTVTDVVPSPTSSSCTFEMLTSTFAAALSRAIALRMVAPSFVTMISPVELNT